MTYEKIRDAKRVQRGRERSYGTLMYENRMNLKEVQSYSNGKSFIFSFHGRDLSRDRLRAKS